MGRTGIVVAALLAFTAVGAAFEPSLDQQSLAEAIALGLSRIDDMRSRFHATYRLEVLQPPVDYIEVVTPFRRVTLDAEAHTRAGERLYGQREALAALGDAPSRVDLVVELTFHPLNNYVGMPDFDVALVPTGGVALEPRSLKAIPRFGPRVSGTPLPYAYAAGQSARQTSQPLLGGSVVATFDGATLDPRGTYGIVIREGGKDLAKTSVNFTRLR